MTPKFSLAALCVGLATVACSKSEPASASRAAEAQTERAPGAHSEEALKSAAPIAVDGSSTVFPINEAMAEEFQKESGVRVTVAASGTGGGFKKFCAKEIALAGASRPIKPSEIEACKSSGVDYIELPIAFDGIAVVVHPENTWVDKMTVEELKRLWAPEAQGKLKTWSDVRKSWPKEEVHLFGAGVDSGTYDYFTKAIVGEEHKSRGDYTSSEDDNVLVKGVSTDRLALGFFGFAYFAENKDSLKVVPIDDALTDNGSEAVAPSLETIASGKYQPLSRPIFIYVNKSEADQKEVQAFVRYYLGRGTKLIQEVGYVKLPAEAYELAQQRFDRRVSGSLFAGTGSKVGVSVTELLAGK